MTASELLHSQTLEGDIVHPYTGCIVLVVISKLNFTVKWVEGPFKILF